MHPHHEHRAHKKERARVGHITKGYAHGGAVHGDEAQDRKLIKKVMAERDAQAVEGSGARERADKRARGGRTKHKGTHVNVIVAPQGGAQPGPMPTPPPTAVPAGIASPVAPRPAMPPPGMPPGMPPRRLGGRTYASGGAVKSGPGWIESEKTKTPVQHDPGKDDQKDVGRGKPITYAKGGRIYSPEGTAKPHALSAKDGGAGGGHARLVKERRAAHHG
jgi:hypothetical protein